MSDRENIRILRRATGRESLFGFFMQYLRHRTKSSLTGKHIKPAQFHINLCSWLDDAMKPLGSLIGAVPRGHGKTTLGTLANTVRAICYSTKKNIVLIAANQKEANDKLRDIITELETNTLLKEDFGEDILPMLDSSKKPVTYKDNEAIFRNGTRVVAMGMLSRGIRGQLHNGRRVDLLIFDDPEDDESVLSKDQRKKQHRWVWSACYNSIDPEVGSFIWLGTILHLESLLNVMINERDDTKFKLPAISAMNPEGELLWPSMWSYGKEKGKQSLLERKAKLGAGLFSQEFMNTPVADEDQTFKPEHWRYYNRRDAKWHHGELRIPDPQDHSISLPLVTYMAVDPAIGQNNDADFFALVVLGVSSETDKIFVLHIHRERAMLFAKQVQLITTLQARYHCLTVFIESQGYQAALPQQVWDRGIPAMEIKHHTNKEARIKAGAIHVQGNRVWLPRGEPATKQFTDEAEGFPMFGHEDQIDAFTMCVQNCLTVGSLGAQLLGKNRESSSICKGF